MRAVVDDNEKLSCLPGAWWLCLASALLAARTKAQQRAHSGRGATFRAEGTRAHADGVSMPFTFRMKDIRVESNSLKMQPD